MTNSPRRSTISLKTSGETRQSLHNSARRCAHTDVIFSPPRIDLPKWVFVGSDCNNNALRDVIGVKRGETVGLGFLRYIVCKEEAEPLMHVPWCPDHAIPVRCSGRCTPAWFQRSQSAACP